MRIRKMKGSERIRDALERAKSTEADADEALYGQLLERNRAGSYADFIAESYGGEPLEAHERAMSEAALAYERGAPGYGRRGEELGGANLSESGYAAYLGAERERALGEARREAESERRQWESEARRGYGAYLEAHRKEQESRMNSAVKMLLNDNFSTGEDAYRYALSVGLEGERAEMLRDMSEAYGADGYRDAGLSARIEMLRYITGRHMGYEEAYRYALALGAPEETAERIARYAESASDPVVDFLNNQ